MVQEIDKPRKNIVRSKQSKEIGNIIGEVIVEITPFTYLKVDVASKRNLNRKLW